MTTLGNENPRDCDSAKRRAQAMKARLKELGHEIPLTHVYETLATSLGFRNWPTMKAHLSSTTATLGTNEVAKDEETVGRPAFLDDDGNQWQLPGSEPRGLEVIYGPPGKGKTSLAQALNLRKVEQYLNNKGAGLPKMTVIDIEGSSHAFIARARELVSRKSRHLVKHVRLRANRTQSLNIFDTPLGLRKPTAAQRPALAHFLVGLMDLPGGDPRFQEVFEIALAAVDRVYAHLSDDLPECQPKPYAKGRLPELDREIASLLPPHVSSGTWWGVVDAFFKAGHVEHAAMAQRFAVPKLDDLFRLMVISTTLRPADRGIEASLEMSILRHMREFPLLSEETDIQSDRAAITAVDLRDFTSRRSKEGVRDIVLAFLIARQAFAVDFFFQSSEHKAVPELYRGHHARKWYVRERERESGLLIYDDIHRLGLGSAATKQVEIDIRESKNRCVALRVSTQGYWNLPSGVAELTSRIFVLGTAERGVAELTSTFGLPSEWANACQSRLTGPTRQGLPFLVAKNAGPSFEAEIVTLVLGAEGLWASVTNPDDVVLRDKVADELGLIGAHNALGKRFPGGSARMEIELRLSGRDVSGLPEEIVEEMRTHVIDKLSKEIASLSKL